MLGGTRVPEAEAQSATALTEEGLRRALSPFHALAIVVGAVVGTGIYIRPAIIAQQVHTPGRLIAVWCVAGLLSLAGALTFAELTARFPRSGGEYVFLRETLGELPAFLFGWMRLTVGVGTLAAMGAGVAVFFTDLVPLPRTMWHFALPSPNGVLAIDIGYRQAVAVVFILLLALLNVSGVARAGRFQGFVTVAKVLGLVGLIGALVFFAPPSAAPAGLAVEPTSPAPDLIAYGVALLAAMAAYNGWAQAPMVAGEVRDPRRTLPLTLIAGVLIATLLYLVVNAAFLHVVSFDDIVASSSTLHPDAPSVASRAVARLPSVHAGRALTLLFLVSAVGTLHCNLLLPSRVLFAMARDGLLPKRLSGIAQSARTPAAAILTLAAMGMTLAALSGYDRLSNMSVFGNLTFYAVSAAGLIRWRYRHPMQEKPVFVTPRGVAELFLVATIILLAALVAGGRVEVLAGLGLMALGLPVYVGILAARHFAERAPGPTPQ